jgi:phospholipid/cholesterol/gamma-HCH transport system ATP-binding protein
VSIVLGGDAPVSIVLDGITKAFGSTVVLDGVALDVQEGETLAVIGASGAGKSVLLKTVVGLIRPDAGTVVVDGEVVTSLDHQSLYGLRRRVGYVFQFAALFDSMTVAENLWLALDDERASRPPAAYREESAALLRRVNLDPNVLDRLPADLSGGMRKRVGVARAIASRPRYVLYDEPTTGLDPVNAETIDRLIMELGRELGVTSIVVTHDLDSAFLVGDRIALLHEGRIHTCATPAEILASEDPVVRRFVRRGRDPRAAAPRGANGWRHADAT